MARAQLLLRFLPVADQMDEWRATIQSLIGFAEAGGSQRAGPSRTPQATTTALAAGRTEGASPLCSPHHGNQRGSRGIKNPTTSRWPLPTPEHIQANGKPLRIGRREVRIIIEQHRDDHRRPNGRGGPSVDEPVLEDGGYLPFEVGCPAFTRELRQVCWPSVRTFKPEIPENYDGRLNLAEFLSIVIIFLYVLHLDLLEHGGGFVLKKLLISHASLKLF